MNRQTMRDRIHELLEELVDIERQLQDKTLSHSDQELLEQAWETYDDEIATLEEIIEIGEDMDRKDQEDYDEEDYDGEYDDDDEPPVYSHTIVKIGENMFVTQGELDVWKNIVVTRVCVDYYV